MNAGGFGTSNLGYHGGQALITSPNYPSVYPDGYECRWSVRASDPSKRIRVTRLHWQVCTYTSVYFLTVVLTILPMPTVAKPVPS